MGWTVELQMKTTPNTAGGSRPPAHMVATLKQHELFVVVLKLYPYVRVKLGDCRQIECRERTMGCEKVD